MYSYITITLTKVYHEFRNKRQNEESMQNKKRAKRIEKEGGSDNSKLNKGRKKRVKVRQRGYVHRLVGQS